MRRSSRGCFSRATGSSAFLLLLLSVLLCVSTLRHVGVSAEAIQLQTTELSARRSLKDDDDNDNDNDNDNDDDDDGLYEGYEVYPVLPSNWEVEAFSEMFIFLTMPQASSESFQGMRNWCRQHSPNIIIRHMEVILKPGFQENEAPESQFTDELHIGNQDDEEDWPYRLHVGRVGLDHAFKERWLDSVLLPKFPNATMNQVNHTKYCVFEVAKLAPRHCMYGIEEYPGIGHGFSDGDLPFTNPYEDLEGEFNGYGTSCTGLYTVNVTIENFEPPSGSNVTEWSSEWTLMRAVAPVGSTSNVGSLFKSVKIGEGAVGSLRISNQGVFDTLVVLENYNDKPDWLEMEQGGQYPDRVAVTLSRGNKLHIILKARSNFVCRFRFTSENEEFSGVFPLSISLESGTYFREYTHVLAMEVKKSVLVIDGLIPTAQTIRRDIVVNERQNAISTYTLGNNGQAQIMWNAAQSDSWLSVDSEFEYSGKLVSCACSIPMNLGSWNQGSICGNQAYYQESTFTHCRQADSTMSIRVDSNALAIGEYTESIQITTNNVDFPVLTITVNLEVKPSLIILSENAISLMNVQPSESKFKLLSVHNFYYREKDVEDYVSGTHLQALQKTLNSTAVCEATVDKEESPWLDAEIINDGFVGFSENTMLNVTVLHNSSLIPGTYTGHVTLKSTIYEPNTDFNQNPSTWRTRATQEDDVVVTFEAVVGPPSPTKSYTELISEDASLSTGYYSSNAGYNYNYNYGSNAIGSYVSGMVGSMIGAMTGTTGGYSGTGYSGSNAGYYGTGYDGTGYDDTGDGTTSSNSNEGNTTLIRTTAGEEITIRIHTLDDAANIRTTPGGTFKAEVSEYGTVIEEIDSIDGQDGTHDLTFSIEQSGTFDLGIFLQDETTFSWTRLTNASENIQILPAEIDATASSFETGNNQGSSVGEILVLKINLKDRFGNDGIHSSMNTSSLFNLLQAELIKNEDSSIVFESENHVDNSSSTLELRFNVTSSGIYRLEMNDVLPVDIPEKMNTIQILAAQLSLEHSSFDTPRTWKAGSMNKNVLELKDTFSNPLDANLISNDIVFWENMTCIEGGCLLSSKYLSPITFSLDDTGLLSVSRQINISGIYMTSIQGYDLLAASFLHIEGSPYNLTVVPAAPVYANFQFPLGKGCMASSTAGTTCEVEFRSEDEYGNIITAVDSNIKETFLFRPVEGSDTDVPITGSIEHKGNGTYAISFKGLVAANYTRDSLTISLTGGDIPVSPTLEILPGLPTATNEQGTATTSFSIESDEVVAGNTLEILVEPKDEHGNPVYLKNSSEVANTIVGLHRGMWLDEDSLGLINVTGKTVVMRQFLNFAEDIVLNMQVRGEISPIQRLIKVVPGALSISKTKAWFRSPAIAGKGIDVDLELFDNNSNKIVDPSRAAFADDINDAFVSNLTLVAESLSTTIEMQAVQVNEFDMYYLNLESETALTTVLVKFNATVGGAFELDLKRNNESFRWTFAVEVSSGERTLSSALVIQSADIDQEKSSICLNTDCSWNETININAGTQYLFSVKAKDSYSNTIPSRMEDKAEAQKYRFTFAVVEPAASGNEIQDVFYSEYDDTVGEYRASFEILGLGLKQVHVFKQYVALATLQTLDALESHEDYIWQKNLMVEPVSCAETSVAIDDGTDCVCKAGYFQLGTECSPCQVGSYKGVGNATTCLLCDSLFTTLAQGSTGVEDCVCRMGYYIDPARENNCLECPEGTMCPMGSTLQTINLLPGRWRASPNSTVILECQRKDHCIGGVTTTVIDDSVCKEGHKGILCGVCEDGYKSSVIDEGSCEICDSSSGESDYLSWGKWVAFCVVLLFFFSVLSFLVNKRKHQAFDVASRAHAVSSVQGSRNFVAELREISPVPLMKIFYNYTVHVSVGAVLKVKLSKLLDNFLQSSESVANGGVDFGMAVMFDGCNSPVPDVNYYKQLTVVLVIPFALVCFSAIFFFAKYLLSTLFTRKKKGGVKHQLGKGSITSNLLYQPDEHRGSKAKDYFVSWLVSVLILMFMVHSSVAKTSFVVFNCFEYEEDKFVIESDYSLECDMEDNEYRMNYMKGLIGVLGYGFGIPITIFLLLFRNRKRLMSKKVLELYGFIHHGFKRKYYWWEVFIMMRKLAIAFCMVALSYHPFLQAFCAAGLMMVYLVSHVTASPFEHKTLNDLESFSLFCSAFTLQCCILYTRKRDSGEVSWINDFEDGLSIVLVLLNVLFVLLMFACIAGTILFSLKRSAMHQASTTQGEGEGGDCKNGKDGMRIESTGQPNPLYPPTAKLDGNTANAYPKIEQADPAAALGSVMMTANSGDYHTITTNPLAGYGK